MRLTDIGADAETGDFGDLDQALAEYDARDGLQTEIWTRHFGPVTPM